MVPVLGIWLPNMLSLSRFGLSVWQQGVAHLLRIFYVSTEGVYLIFGCCALCAWSVSSRFVSFYFFWISFLQGMVYYLLYTSVVELDHGSPHVANFTLLFAEGIRLLTLLPIVLLFINSSWKGEKFNQIYPMFVSFVISFLFVCPPLAFQMHKLDVATPSEKSPQGLAMYGGALQSADRSPLISTATQSSRNHSSSKMNWWCNTQYRQDWDTKQEQ